jgi:hypothetical protein
VATGGVADPHMGEQLPGFFDAAADVIAAHVPNATRRIVAGQTRRGPGDDGLAARGLLQ